MLLTITGTTWTQNPEYGPEGVHIQATEIFSEAAGFEEVERVDDQTVIWKVGYRPGAEFRVGPMRVSIVQKERLWYACIKHVEDKTTTDILVPGFQTTDA